MSTHETWLHWWSRAYEWAHNNHHPGAGVLNQFAQRYADSNQDKRTPQPLNEAWMEWKGEG